MDARDAQAMFGDAGPCGAVFDERTMLLSWTDEEIPCPAHGDTCPGDDDGDDDLARSRLALGDCPSWQDVAVHHLPCRYEVCSLCNGKGSHVNPSIDSDGLTQEDFAEDPDFQEDYFAGIYHVECYRCHGRRVEPVVDRNACQSEKQKRSLAVYDQACEDAYSERREREAEMRWGY